MVLISLWLYVAITVAPPLCVPLGVLSPRPCTRTPGRCPHSLSQSSPPLPLGTASLTGPRKPGCASRPPEHASGLHYPSMCWFLHCGPGPCLKHHHKLSNQIQWTESQNMAIQKLILYKTFHCQELKFYIESPKVSENLINFDCNKWKVMIQSSIIFELVPARSQWYICTKNCMKIDGDIL